MRLVRYIHAVGQGAFYTEQFFDDIIDDKPIATVVYDCGAEKNLAGVNHEIHGMFEKNDVIDILFISHFHSDHINGIVELKKRTKIRNVIIPLYEQEMQLLLLATVPSDKKNDKTYHEVEKLIINPEEFFGNDTRVYRVKRVNNEVDSNQRIFNLDEMQPMITEIESGCRVTCSLLSPYWEYIPFNFMYQERHNEFMRECQNNNIDLDNLQGKIGNKSFLSALKKVYKAISPKTSINENSMMLYSGQCFKLDDAIACLYTGDATISDAVINDLKKLLNYRCDSISMLQIPHHASRKSFSTSIFDLIRYRLPRFYLVLFVSLGNKNTYGHPSSYVITQCNLFLNHLRPPRHPRTFRRNQRVKIVSEEKSSMLVLQYYF